jgi:uncharacterized SAM-binding protein YcdF (DUF218 family)
MNFRQDQNLLRPRTKRGVRIAALVLLLLIAGGAGIPHLLEGRVPGPRRAPADAILVLTGDENRIPEGYRAWREGRAGELYILGAGGGARLDRILPGNPALTRAELRRLHVEGWSENTLENAISAKGVVAERNFRTVILVTSDYHVPRAHLAFRTVLPAAVSIDVIPVPSEWRGWAMFPRTLRLFFIEGWKYWGYRIFLPWEYAIRRGSGGRTPGSSALPRRARASLRP